MSEARRGPAKSRRFRRVTFVRACGRESLARSGMVTVSVRGRRLFASVAPMLETLRQEPETRDPGGSPDAVDDVKFPERFRKIRCPQCRWQPGREDRWWCRCGHTWNTFDTGGRCPACSLQWLETACLSCKQWSLHSAWYAED